MNDVFIGILNNALISSFLIIAVIVVRFFIKRAPKWIACALWALVAIKLVLPFRMESVLSLVPSSQPIPSDIEYTAIPHIETGVAAVNQVVNPVLVENFSPKPEYSVNPLQIVIFVCSNVWLIGILCLLLYLFISYFILRKKVEASKKIEKNVFVCDEVRSPFILGIVKPRIYLPSGLSADGIECVLEHERTHLKRCDHLWKPLGFIILSLYWFHPLCWVAYVLLCKDIELACDEKVTKDKDNNWKATYCQTLLDCNNQRKMITVCPVAFGEVSVKKRVKSVLRYKKPGFWIVVIAIAISTIVAVCFMTNPADKSDVTDVMNENEDKLESDEIDTTVTAIAEKWAKAFIEGDGQTIISMSAQDVGNDFENRGILVQRGDDIYFGFGSSPMLDWGEDVKSYIVLNQDEVNQTADILYFAWTSDPHVTVLREQITYTKSNSEYLVSAENFIFYDNITSVKELLEAYPFALEGSLMDYYRGNNLGTALNENALSRSNIYQDLFQPETAALNLLNIDRNGIMSTEEITYGDADVRTVILHMSDGVVEIEMIRPYGSDGIWLPRQYRVGEPEMDTENQRPILSEGKFDNIMGYSGHYIYYDGYPPEGFYYTYDGTLLAHVWGTIPENTGVIDLDGDGKNELIAGLMWADGATDVVVYKEFESGIRYAFCSELLEEPYDNFGVGSLDAEYVKDTNQVKISYWTDAEQSYKTSIYDIYLNSLTWWIPDWLDTTSQYNNTSNETRGNEFWGDQRDWTCGTISEIMPGTVNGTEFTISLKYFVSEDDSEMIRKLGLSQQEDFPSGYAIVPIGETRIYPISEKCEFIFIDWSHAFDNDSRVKSYEDTHVITDDYSVFQEYLDTYTSLNHQIFFYDIQNGKIQTIYETALP